MIFYVENAAEFSSAITVAKDGDTIKLAAGNYDALTIKGKHADISGLTITSADSSHPAVLSSININTSSGIKLTGVEVGVVPNTTGVTVGSSANISLTNLKVHGTTTADSGNGFMIRSSTGVTVSNVEVHHVNEGIDQFDNTYLTIQNSNFHNLGADGIRGGGSSWVSIKNNYFTDFDRVSAEHPDAIQFWTTNEKVSSHDIDVENNVIVRGAGVTAQGIFITDQTHVLPYSNVTVANNAVVGMLYNGIMVEHTNGATIANNLVAGYADTQSWIRVENDSNIQLTGNQATYKYITNGSGIVSTGNTTVSVVDPSNPTTLNSWLAAHDLTGAAPTVSLAGSTSLSLAASTTTTTTSAMTQVIAGTSGSEYIKGTTGDDVIDGKGGYDTMAGGAGNDVYFVDSYQDVVVENAGQGSDTVRFSLGKYTLPANVENLVLTASTPQAGYGNALNNTMWTNHATSTLSGGDGNDTLIYQGGTATLTGGAGHDTFQLAAVPSSTPVNITDFVRGTDHLDLSPLLDAYHGTNPVADGWVKFVHETGGLGVYVDTDGPTGAAGMVEVAKLTGVTVSTLSSTDWIF